MSYLYFTEQELNFENELLAACESMIKELPDFRLTQKKFDGRSYYYVVNRSTGKRTYVRNGKVNFIEEVKQRAFLQILIKRIRNNQKQLPKMLKMFKSCDFEEIRNSLSKEYRDIDLEALARGLFGTYRRENRAVVHNPFHPEQKTTITSFGLAVRSKSEGLIAEFLYKEGIDFEYEEELVVMNPIGEPEIYYPDFTIYAKSGEIILWEHFGLLHKESYRESNFDRLTNYYYSDYLSGKNLIITMEKLGGGIDMEAITRNISWLKEICR